MTFQVAAEYCSNPNVFPTASSSFIVQNNISRKVESTMVKIKVETSMPEVKVESSTMKSKVESSVSKVNFESTIRVELNKVKVESSMVKCKVEEKVESSILGMKLSNFDQKMKMGDKTQVKAEKRKSSRLLHKGPDEKRRLIG